MCHRLHRPPHPPPPPTTTHPPPLPSRSCTWEDPYGGDCTDTFELSPDGGTLTQHTDMSIRGSGRRTQYK
jgi:hypothetical protein